MLSTDLKDRIIKAYNTLKSYRAVANQFSVSHVTVRKYVLELHEKEPKQRGPKPKTNRRDESRIRRAVASIEERQERVTASKVQEKCDLQQLSTRTIRRKLSSMGLSYGKAKKRIVLTTKQKDDRLEFARKGLTGCTNWTKTIFTDEKRFNADGPDSWCSWMRKDSRIVRNRRQQGGPSIQVWGMIMPGPLLVVIELPPRGGSAEFMEFIEARVLPTIRSIFGDDFIFQQDNCSTHVSVYSSDRFAELGVELLAWPSRSPDLNIIENCWSVIAHEVYDGRQFASEKDLWPAIDRAVSHINAHKQDALQKLFDSIPRRLLDCVDRKGDLTDY